MNCGYGYYRFMAGESRPRPLQLSYTHPDGTVVRYAIEYDRPNPAERDGANGSGASMLFYCLWEQRFKLKEILLGFNEIKDTGSERYLRRVNPTSYHNGYTNPESYEGWLYCIDIETFGEAPLPTSSFDDATEAGITNVSRWPHYKYACIRAQFVGLLHDILEDEDTTSVDGRREWLRNCIIQDKPGGKYTQDRQQVFKWVDDSAPAKFAPAFWDAYEDITVQWLDVPWVPLKAIRNCIGRVNITNILKGARGLPDGIAVESALLVAAEIVVKPKVLNRRYADITYYIRRVQKPAMDDEVSDHGHNELPRIVTEDLGSGTMGPRRRFIYLSLDGTTSTRIGNMLYDLADYEQLFEVPDSVDL